MKPRIIEQLSAEAQRLFLISARLMASEALAAIRTNLTKIGLDALGRLTDVERERLRSASLPQAEIDLLVHDLVEKFSKRRMGYRGLMG